QAAVSDGSFLEEIVPVAVNAGKSERIVGEDEQQSKAKLDEIPLLKPAFREGGTVTAANCSPIADGAAALTLMRLSRAQKRGVAPLASIRGHATHSQAPNLFTTAPVGAIRKLCERIGWDIATVDLFEINEAFAVVPMVALRDLDLPPEKVNAHGGACALG